MRSSQPFTVFLLAFTLVTLACAAPESPAPASPSDRETPVEVSATEMPPAPRVEMVNVGQPLPGVLTAGQPTDEQLAELAEKKYRTVVNLRSEVEVAETGEQEKVEALGLRYVSIPMAGAADLTVENAAALDAVLADSANYPVLVHCASSNRAGGLLALRAHQLQGVEASEALALGLDAGLTSLEPAVRELLSLLAAPE